MTKHISFSNRKGGVGKTTNTIQFALHLASHGYKVAVIDLDSQCNLTDRFKDIFNVENFDFTISSTFKNMLNSLQTNFQYPSSIMVNLLHDIDFQHPITFIAGDERLESTHEYKLLHQCFSIVEGQYLSLLSNPSLKGSPHFRKTSMTTFLDSFKTLSSYFDKEGYDYVLYDLCPSLTVLNILAFQQLDYVVCPVRTSYQSFNQSFKGVSQMEANLKEFCYDFTMLDEGYYKSKETQLLGVTGFNDEIVMVEKLCKQYQRKLISFDDITNLTP